MGTTEPEMCSPCPAPRRGACTETSRRRCTPPAPTSPAGWAAGRFGGDPRGLADLDSAPGGVMHADDAEHVAAEVHEDKDGHIG